MSTILVLSGCVLLAGSYSWMLWNMLRFTNPFPWRGPLAVALALVGLGSIVLAAVVS